MVVNNASTQAIQPMPVPTSYSRVLARELDLQERDLHTLLEGTGLQSSVLTECSEVSATSAQQMRILENALLLTQAPELGLRLGRRLQPATHGPLGYLILSCPDVLTSLQAFAQYLPTRLPFSTVTITQNHRQVECQLTLNIQASNSIQRLLQECFALMIQSIGEASLAHELDDARIELQHAKPDYHHLYRDYFHSPVEFSQTHNRVIIPLKTAQIANTSGNTDSYRVALELCQQLVDRLPSRDILTSHQVKRLLLSHPIGSVGAEQNAQELFIAKRTLQRRLDREGTSYREIVETILADLASNYLSDPRLSIESIAFLLGYNDSAAFRKAFRRWYGISANEYRSTL